MKKIKYINLLFGLFIINFSFFNDSKIFLEKGSNNGFCDNSGVLKALNILGRLLTVVKILIPVIIIIVVIKKLYLEVVINKNESSTDITRNIISKIIIGLLIFFVPTLAGIYFNYLNGYDNTQNSFTKCSSCILSNCNNLINDAVADEQEKEITSKKNTNSLNDNSTSNLGVSNNEYYGKGCTAYVPSSSYNSNTVNSMFNAAEKLIGTPYSKLDCSSFVKKAYKNIITGGTAASEAKALSNKCVRLEDVKPGDVFFISYYNKSGKCTGCLGETWGDRCGRWNCLMHTGIVAEVSGGKITKILHSSTGGVKYKSNPSYKYEPSSGGNQKSGKGWYIMIIRPYA